MAKRKSKPRRTWRWVSAHEPFLTGVTNSYIRIWISKDRPPLDGKTGQHQRIVVSCKEFKKLFGITIKPGECLKVEFSARIIEELPCKKNS